MPCGRRRARRARARATFSRTPRKPAAVMSLRELSSSAEPVAVPSLSLPPMFTLPPPVHDDLSTVTSQVQDAVVEACLPLLSGSLAGMPRLERARHVQFLRRLLDGLPAGYVAADASRPWYLYWLLSGLTLLGEDVRPLAGRLVPTARAMQNPGGGFGGGGGQLSHLATTYSIVLALALVGGADAYALVDRRTLWRWLCSLKCPDGGFRMCLGGEEDIRGAYCATVIITLLHLPIGLDPDCEAAQLGCGDLFAGLADYVGRCQTFEGGISAMPNTEAHGAYAFCALGCLSLLDSPCRSIPQHLDVPRLMAWLSSRQYAPEGGLSGRTNKLVDGCYSHWVGGCWPLIEACLERALESGVREADEQGLVAAGESLFSREGLIRYILCCCQDQSKRGGLRDKPGKPPDAYHSCYTLTGLSAAQRRWKAVDGQAAGGREHTAWVECWQAEGQQTFDELDRVPALHPLYAIPQQCVEEMRGYFAQRPGF